MKKFLLVCLSVVLFYSCGSEKIIPIDVVLRADKAMLETKNVSFKLVTEFKSKQEISKDTFNIQLQRNTNDTILGYKLNLSNNQGLHVTYNGDEARFTSLEDKKVMIIEKNSNPEAFVMNSGLTFAFNNFMINKSQKEFLEKIKDTLVYKGNEEINGIKTYNIQKIGTAEQGVKVIETISYSSDDNLPRKYARTSIYQGDTVAFVFKFENVDLNSNLDNKNFTIEIPAGYTSEIFKQTEEGNGLQNGATAPDFSLKDATGKVVTLASLKGKVVLIDFWGTWCKWCVKAMPYIEKLYQKYQGKNFTVIGISCQEPKGANPVKFMVDNNITYQTLLNGDEVASKFKVSGFPTFYLIDKNGKIILQSSGFDDKLVENLSPIIDKNL